ncbi:hypothetical protein EPN90_03870 [Patescibacteria group bacterium]|nr:MAG: hypothetical protein EPN90_03870 [Patescibacteria group bacterium]
MQTPSTFARILGELEQQVMQVLWTKGGTASIREVVDIMRRERPIAYTTVLTVMNRLTAKGLLRRTNDGESYVYTTPFSPQKFYSRVAAEMLSRIREQHGEMAVACFVDEASKISRKKLKNLLKELRQKK